MYLGHMLHNWKAVRLIEINIPALSSNEQQKGISPNPPVVEKPEYYHMLC